MINSIIELVLDYWTPSRKELWKEYEKTDKSIPWQEYEHLRNGLVQSTAQKRRAAGTSSSRVMGKSVIAVCGSDNQFF